MMVDNDSIKNFISHGSRTPEPPKAGEIMICQMCGKPIYPEDFSTDEFRRRREFKWHLHSQCLTNTEKYLDKCVPGLEKERITLED